MAGLTCCEKRNELNSFIVLSDSFTSLGYGLEDIVDQSCELVFENDYQADKNYQYEDHLNGSYRIFFNKKPLQHFHHLLSYAK